MNSLNALHTATSGQNPLSKQDLDIILNDAKQRVEEHYLEFTGTILPQQLKSSLSMFVPMKSANLSAMLKILYIFHGQQ